MIKKIVLLIFVLGILTIFPAAQADEFDFEGETITIYNQRELSEDFSEGEGLYHLEYVEDKYNCKIEFVDTNFAGIKNELEAGVMAGELQNSIFHPHTLMVENNHYWDYLLPLNEILEDKYWEKEILAPFKKIKESTTYAGKYYGFAGHGASGIISEAHLLHWNKDFFEREGLPNLYDLMEAGEWTYDKFMEISQKVTRDTTGDGDIDQWGYTSDYYQHAPLASTWAFTNNAQVVTEIDGKMTFTFDNEEATDALQFYVDMVNNHEISAPLGEEGADLFREGKVAMVNRDYGYSLDLWEDMEDDYGVAYLPKGPKADDYIVPGRLLRFFALPITAENPRGLIAVFNSLFKNTTEYRTDEDLMDEFMTNISMAVRDRQSLEIIEEAITEKFKLAKFLLLGEPRSDTPLVRIKQSILEGEQSAVEGMEEISGSIQTELDDIFN